jgi:branched-chain amino acid:cation transporter, LIVCS family
LKKLDILFIGFMLFSMFFGAGNLIFPPFLGAQSGTSFWLAMTGFILTGVGLPFAVLLAVSLVKGGVQTIGNRVHPLFSTIFMVVIYLCIGPFLAIPRNANVAYEMGVKSYLPGQSHSSLFLFIFTVVFFLLVYLVSLNPSKMEKYMGRWITPVLLIAMVVLCAAGFFKLHAPIQQPAEAYQSGALFKGFIQGYSTMDALASLAFGIVILTSISQKGIDDRKQLSRYTLKAAIIAGILLSFVYISLGKIGAKMAAGHSYHNGTELLSDASVLLLGQGGKALLGFIFTLACFTTVVGLTTACGQYFSKLIPKASYKQIISAVTLVGFFLSNLGLDQILKVSVPFLVTAYPLTIVLVALTFFSKYFRNKRKVYGSAILFTGIFALIDGIFAFGLTLGPLQEAWKSLPLSKYGLEWIIPAIAGTLFGILISAYDKKDASEDEKDSTMAEKKSS